MAQPRDHGRTRAAALPSAMSSTNPLLPELRSFDFRAYQRDHDGPGLDAPTDWVHVDDELIAQCDRLVEARAEFLRLYCGQDAPDEPDAHPVIGPRLAELDAVESELLPLLAGMRASSLACAEAMARVALLFAEREANWQVPEGGRDWPGMAAVEWLAGDDFYFWSATHPSQRSDTPPPPVRRAVAAVSAKATELNGELLNLCALFEEQQAAVRRVADDRKDKDSVKLDAALDDWWSTMKKITNAPARTPEGIRAKAGAVRTAVVGTTGDQCHGVQALIASLLTDMLGETV